MQDPGAPTSKSTGVWRGILTFLAVTVVAAPGLIVVPTASADPAVAVVGASDDVAGRGVPAPTGVAIDLDLPPGTESVGFTWSGDDVALTVRSKSPSGWSRWVTLEHEADHGDRTDDARRGAGPVWTGPGTSAVEVVATGGTPVDLAAHVTGADGDATAPTVLTGAGGAEGGRAVRPNAAWGSPGWSFGNCPDGPATTRPVEAVVVHHTATTTGYSADQVDDVLRSIHRFHTRTRGWCDIAYNFLVDRFGRIWEGRTGGIALPVRGGHARGFNTATTGIALLGDFDSHALPDAATEAVALLASWKAAANDFDPGGAVERVSGGSTSIPAGHRVVIGRVSGHRDVSATSCPGRHGHALLDRIRQRARERLAAPSPFRFGGRVGDELLVGSWSGDGPGVGIRRGDSFHLRDDLTAGAADTVVRLGLPTDQPVAGDWNGDGTDTVGVERNGEFHLLERNETPGPLGLLIGSRTVRAAVPPDYPLERAVPLAGDWDGDGIDTVGYAADGEILLFEDAAAQRVARRYRIGWSGDRAVVADWEADGVDTVGLVRDRVLYAPEPSDHRALRAVHRLPAGHRAFVVDWTGQGLPTLLTGDRAGRWDPTTPVGL